MDYSDYDCSPTSPKTTNHFPKTYFSPQIANHSALQYHAVDKTRKNWINAQDLFFSISIDPLGEADKCKKVEWAPKENSFPPRRLEKNWAFMPSQKSSTK